MLLEINATIILKENKFTVFNQSPYYDPIKKKIRTIDIKATNATIKWKKDKAEYVKGLTLFIECKKNESKIVFFLKTQFEGKMEIFSRGIKQTTLSQIDHRYSYPSNAVGIVYQTVMGGDYFYGAQMQLLKSIEYTIGKIDKKEELIIPIILIEGDMFELSLINGDYKIKRIDFLQFLSQGIPEDDSSVLIDVVNIGAFQSYLNMVKQRFELFPEYSDNLNIDEIKK